MGIQMSGIASGMDTQSIIADLMKAERTKVDVVDKRKTLVEWKKEAWSDMNAKLYTFYKESVYSLKMSSTYQKKNLTSSNESLVTVTNSTSAVLGSHSIEVNAMAKSAQFTGRSLATGVDETTTMNELIGLADGDTRTIRLKSKAADVFGASNEITVTHDDTIASVINKLKEVDPNVNISLDSNYDRIFISSKTTGAENAISFDESSPDSLALLRELGLANPAVPDGQTVTQSAGSNAQFTYNGVTLSNSTNEIQVNGLSFTIRGESGTATVAATQDNQAIYNSVKDFVTKYNALLEEMNTKLDAESARKYEPLTDDEKEAMTEDEVKLWEAKIKGSILRRDDILTSISSEMRSTLTMSSGVTGVTGEYKYLSDLGITTGNYTEKGQLHIQGDEDDKFYSLQENKLMKAIETNLDDVVNLLTKVGEKMYSTMTERMKSSTQNSALTLYNDKLLTKEINDYDDRIYTLEERLLVIEERYYSQFTAMEQAIQQSNSTGSWLTQQLSSLG